MGSFIQRAAKRAEKGNATPLSPEPVRRQDTVRRACGARPLWGMHASFACGQVPADVGVRQENLVSALVSELTRNEKRVHVDFASKLKVRSRVGLHAGAVVRMYGAALAGHFFQVLAVWLPACRGPRR